MDDEITLVSRAPYRRSSARSPTPETAEEENGTALQGTGNNDMSQPVVNKLYGIPRPSGVIDWYETMPRQLQAPLDFSGSAMVLRYLPDTASETRALQFNSMLICSPFLKGLILRLFDEYPGQDVHVTKPRFAPPFHPFYHQYSMLIEELAKQDKALEAEAEQLSHLVAAIDEEIGERMIDMKALAAHGQTTFDTLWSLFPPGCPVIRGAGSNQQCYLIEDCSYVPTMTGTVFSLKLLGLDHDGREFGWVAAQVNITSFIGTAEVSELQVIPVHHFRNAANNIEAAATRGSSVCELLKSKTSYKQYEGFAVFSEKCMPRVE
ncbi:hypothetical protein Slin15195_G118570 [Septoria linicola]|uniref:DUF7025 domain-containing protein n=1 Tax=Septoria linicola TaxID=215465 RepID=A0A9Q9B406_9PEZI|nr:hypothetical protein Slin14017_G095560 [Septoria linicola]USW58538.1 hypothetical protein Slin15195_G118570 [Septoria linicola]